MIMATQADKIASSWPFENILNFRDVGATINQLAGKPLMREGELFRSARPDDATKSDRDKLVHNYSVKTVIDLRSKTEHINQAKKRNARVSSSAALPQSNDVASDAVKIPNVQYHEINLNGGGFEKALLRKLGWMDLGKLAGLMAFGYRNEGISIIGKNVMQPRGLTGLGKDTLDHSDIEIRQVFEVLANSNSYPILVHCTQGKDRTGLVVLLVLALLHIDARYIETDYMMSEKQLEPEREERMKEISAIGLDEEFAGCPAGFADAVVDHINQQYGGIEQYLDRIHVDQKMQETIKQKFAITS